MFVRPLYREKVMRSICAGIQENGCLLLVEKVLGDTSLFNRLFIERYYAYKRRRGYSELEIAQKREALENVLIPYRLSENRDLLLGAGIASNHWLALLTFTVAYSLMYQAVTLAEEHYLRGEFGASFDQYCARVPR
jgi:hypothetical protein